FSGCTNLTSITIPNSVTSIELGAFSRCTSLKSITIPDSVTTIGFRAFHGCSNLTSITIPNSVTNIEQGTFCGCSSLTFIKVPNGVTEIGLSAFENCSSLNHIIIPDSLNNQDTNYWAGRGIDLNKTQLVTHSKLSEWAKRHKLKEKSIEKLSTLYQLQKDDDYQPSWSELGKKSRHIIIGDLLTILPKDKKNVVLPRILIGQHDNKEEQLLHTLSLLSRATEEHAVQEKVSSHEDTSTQTKASQESQKANSLSLGASLSSDLTLAETAKILLLSVEKPKKTENKTSGSTEKVSSTIPSIRTSPDREDYPTQNPRGR
ncbi:MAG: leucine-rich repeat domain-containing protein, partial [Pseudomonadota bacterium]|nr:leucine-rich repeat domain-containing protein [Pseudomonadota bacterium]